MRTIAEIAVHCTATPAGREQSVADITRMHRARGFATIGYHYLVGLDGTVHTGRPVDQVGAHVESHNLRSIGVAYVGGLAVGGKRAEDTRTPAQRTALRALLAQLLRRFPTIRSIKGHRDYSPDLDHDGQIEPNEWIKQCPCFDAIPEYRGLLDDVAARPPAPAEARVKRTLRQGAGGADVGTLQRRLTSLAYYDGRIDDDFGPLTKAAVEIFQRSRGLTDDGVVGPVTREALGI